jgi:hypothetical protein
LLALRIKELFLLPTFGSRAPRTVAISFVDDYVAIILYKQICTNGSGGGT